MASHRDLLIKEEKENKCLSDLLRINFKDGHFLVNSGRNICTVPFQCMEELLSSMQLIQVKNHDKNQQNQPLNTRFHYSDAYSNFQNDTNQQFINKHPQEYNQSTPIKVGQIFYIQFYFSKQYIYYDSHNNKLVLSRDKHTAFKIIEHISKTTATNQEQTVDFIGNVVPNQNRYLIVIANELLYLKYADHSVYMGTYDEKCIVTFSHSIFKADKKGQNLALLSSPCRLYSVQQQKYLVFDIKNRQVVLKKESVCIQGMCTIETADFHSNQAQSPTLPFHRKKSRITPQKRQEKSYQVAIRVLQGNNRYFLTHQNSSTEKLTQDLGKMLHPMEERLNNSHTFLLRFQPSFAQQYRPQTTFNLSNISNISMGGPLNLVEEEEKEEIIEQLTIKELSLKGKIGIKDQLCFLVQFYPSYNGQYQLFIYDSMVSKERIRGREVLREKQLYLDYRQIVFTGKQQCVLKEYSSQKMKRQSPKFKNILRVQFITRQMLTPFLHYYSLLLNLKVYHYHRQPNYVGVRGSEQRLKMRLNLQEIQEILTEYYASIQALAESNKEKTEFIMRQLLQINFIGILQELLQAIIAKKQYEEREEGYREKDFRQFYPYETIQSTKIISKLLLFIGQTMPDRLIDALLKTTKCLLFMRLCKFQQMNSFFSKVQLECIDDPHQMLKKLEKVIERAQQDGKSMCRNICILWAFRIMKKHRLQNDSIQTLSQRLIQSYKGKLTEEYLIVLELIKVSRGEQFYSSEVVKFLPLQRLQQEQIPYPLRQAYFRRIIQNYQDGIRLPFRPKLFFIGKSSASLQQDNQRILRNFLQEVLPKNSKFQTIQNKMFALLFAELYLCFGGDLLSEVTVEQLSCRDYLPQLIVLLQEQLQNYLYEQQHEAKFVMQLLKCLQLALEKEIRYIIYEQNELCFEDEELIVKNCLEQYSKIFTKKIAHATTRNSLQQRDSVKNKQQRISKAQRLLNLFSKQKPTVSGEITQSIDKQIIWKQINDRNRLNAEQRLNIFESVLNIGTLLLSPSLRFRQYYHRLVANPHNLSLHFIAVVQMIANKAYQHDLWNLVQRLTQRFSEDEWRAIIAIINSNHLLTHFILFPRHKKPTQRHLATLYGFLNQLLLGYLEWTNSRIALDYSRNANQENFMQIQTNYHHYPNDLEPDNFVYLLSQVQPSYLIEQMALHQTLVHSMGTITNLTFYNFYSQYIVRYQCQNFHNSIINLSLTFMNTLTAPLRAQFANNFQYSLFKQGSQLKNLISQLCGVRENLDNTPQRATNFNILTQLKDERVSRLSFSSEDSEKEFLVGLFRLLAEVQTHSTTHKQILPKLGYPVIISVLGRYSVQILLKHEVSKFLLSSIEKQMAYGLNKYLKRGKQEASQGQDQEQDSEEYAILLEFVKQSNYLLQRETQAFKRLKLSDQHSTILVSYASTLLSIVRIRDNILGYFKFERTERVYRSDSDLSDAPSLTSRSITSQQSSLISSSIVAREEQVAARVRQMMYHYNAVQIDESQVENIEGINKLLCYQVIQALDGLTRTSELPPSLQKPLHWVNTYYKISLTNQSQLENEAIPRKQLLYKLDKSYLAPKINRQVHRMTRNTFIEQGSVNESQATAPNYQSINHFLSLNVQGYLVLLIELLQRHMLTMQKTKSIEYDGLIMHLMILIETQLVKQIRLYKLEDQQFGKQDFEVLPQQYYKIFGYQSEQDEREEKQHQKCCDLPEKKLESLFQLLLVAHRLDKPIFLLYLLNILERTAFYNITNQTTLQRIISTHFQSFYQMVFAIVHRFRTLSPILDNSFFTVAKLLDPEYISWQKIYSTKSAQQRGKGWVQGLRGMQGFHQASLNYYMLVKMLLACSRSLNFQFKSLFAKPTIERESVISEIINVLSTLLRNFSPNTQEKMEFTRISLKLVNTFLRGPVQPNIQIALNRNYSRFLVQLLDISNKSMVQGMLMVHLLKIKRLIAEGMFILIPFIRLPDKELRSCEDGLRQSYIRSKKAYNGQFNNIISDYVEKKESNELALLYFQLALSFYYCLIQTYTQRGNNLIVDVQVQLLARERREKRRRKNWMVFYQIYEVIVAIVEPIYRRLRGKYEELTDERSEEELLRRAIVFFTKHVSQVQVKVYGKIKKISFLLPQQASGYNFSIRKEFYRLIGKEQRQLRLNKFMKISKYIIIQLQISKAVRRVLSHFKPVQVIVLNRQLWKSFCFLNALLLNILFIFTDTFNNIDSTFFLNTRYLILAITFLFIVFLYLIYFLEVLPLKLKVYSILRRRGFTMSSLIIFIKDKTLGFALFYTIFLALSIYMQGFVSVLLFDYLFRFKVSSKISFLIFRSIPKIFYVIILLFTMLYVVALLSIQQQQRTDSCIDVASCTQSLFFIFMNLRFNVQLPYQKEGVLPLFMVLLRIFTKIILLSLLVGIIFMEKRKDDHQAQAQLLQVRDVCFICGGLRNAIEKARNSNKGFDTHVQMEHNLWNYIYYLVYLKNKQRKNLNAIQGMIIGHWDANQIDWLPDNFL